MEFDTRIYNSVHTAALHRDDDDDDDDDDGRITIVS